MLFAKGKQREWVNVTAAYFVIANLFVLWWYADTTKQLLDVSRAQVATSGDQLAETIRASRIAHKPFVVIEGIQKDHGWFHYFVRNIGPGLAVNVWLLREAPNGEPLPQSLGSLGPGDSRLLFGPLEKELCDQAGVYPIALFAEGLITRTAQWTATINVRERASGSEMRNKPFEIRIKDTARTFEQLVAEEWVQIRESLRNSTGGM